MMKHLALVFLIIVLFFLNIILGSVDIPLSSILKILCGDESQKSSWQFIILQSRLPQAITATLAGGSLAISGLMLQTAFRNPLADPSIFGISTGAGLGVAIVMLFLGGSITTGVITITGYAAIFLSAFVGAMIVMAIIFCFSLYVRSSVMLLIIGIMIGYLSSSAISLLNFFSTEEGVKTYFIWGLGDFGSITLQQIPFFATVCLIGLLASLLLIKPLNILLLGERYAENLGISIKVIRNLLLVITGLLTAIVTAFCGPISFIGLIVPHIARMIIKSDDHRIIIPTTILIGSAVALFCNLMCIIPGSHGVIPLNAITPLIGAPVIIYIIMRRP